MFHSILSFTNIPSPFLLQSVIMRWGTMSFKMGGKLADLNERQYPSAKHKKY